MSYLERDGRAGENGAPAGEGFGMGRFDGNSDVPSVPPKAPSFRPTELEPYAEADFDLIGLHAVQALDKGGRPLGKAPSKGWRDSDPMTTEEAAAHMAAGCNVGVRLRRCHLVVDVDPRNFDDGDDPLRRLGAELKVDWTDFPIVITGSGGKHIYMRKPDDVEVVNGLLAYPGVEFKSFGRQVVAAGSLHPEAGMPYLWDDDLLAVPLRSCPHAPTNLIEALRRPETSATAEPGEYTGDDLAKMLTGLNVTDYSEHDRWLELMMACHHATGGDGREEFIGWSVGDPAYRDHAEVIGRRWDGLKANIGRRQVTVRTLIKALVDAGRTDVIPRSSAEDDFADDLPDDANLANNQATNVAATPRRRRGVVDEWVYVIDAEMFVRRADGKKWKKEQWKARFASLKPEGDVLNAIWKGSIPLRKFEALVYLPGDPEFPDGEEGGRYNIWRESGIKRKAGDVTPFLDHMAYLFEDEVERSYVLDYLAMLIQAPGRKVNYALLVKGDQGTGKSWIGRLMAKIIGQPNMVFPANSEVMSNWTAWTEGAQLAVIEELMAMGRLEMANKLKPIITEPFLRIEAKNCNLYSIPNRLNLIAFTNHADAVPIERGDRRWLVAFSDALPRDESYYEGLFTFLEGDGPGAVRDWLLNRSVGLSPKGMAPATAGKAVMRKLSMGEAEQFLAEQLEDGAAPFAFDLVRFEDVMNSVPFHIQRRTRDLRGRVTRWLCEGVGAVKHSRFTKSDGSGRVSSPLWSVRNHAEWEAKGAAARADAFAKQEAPDGLK